MHLGIGRELTSAAAVTEVGKSPDIANANGIADESEYELSFGCPIAALRIALDSLLFCCWLGLFRFCTFHSTITLLIFNNIFEHGFVWYKS